MIKAAKMHVRGAAGKESADVRQVPYGTLCV